MQRNNGAERVKVDILYTVILSAPLPTPDEMAVAILKKWAKEGSKKRRGIKRNK